ncbi:MAG: hypothetical protein QG599_2781 [Pseudomonadota bacterium]|nr:hypothetical protein [Pseudomonadota bacterium]
MHVDLYCEDNQQESRPFRVKLLDGALDQLMADARQAYRVYELFAIQRPRDIWKYLWVHLIDVPATVWAHYQQASDQMLWYLRQTWPTQTLPLSGFDQFFCWSGDDTRAEDRCWLKARNGATVKAYITQWLLQIRAAQEALRASNDLLITHEIQAITAVDHPDDYGPARPFVLTSAHYASPTRPKHAPGYYAQLGELLARPDVRSVVYGGRHDFQTLRPALYGTTAAGGFQPPSD